MRFDFANVKVPDDPLEVAEIYLSYGLVAAAIECLTEATPRSGYHQIRIADSLSEIKRTHPDWEQLLAARHAQVKFTAAGAWRRLAYSAMLWGALASSVALVGCHLWLNASSANGQAAIGRSDQ